MSELRPYFRKNPQAAVGKRPPNELMLLAG